MHVNKCDPHTQTILTVFVAEKCFNSKFTVVWVEGVQVPGQNTTYVHATRKSVKNTIQTLQETSKNRCYLMSRKAPDSLCSGAVRNVI